MLIKSWGLVTLCQGKWQTLGRVRISVSLFDWEEGEVQERRGGGKGRTWGDREWDAHEWVVLLIPIRAV